MLCIVTTWSINTFWLQLSRSMYYRKRVFTSYSCRSIDRTIADCLLITFVLLLVEDSVVVHSTVSIVDVISYWGHSPDNWLSSLAIFFWCGSTLILLFRRTNDEECYFNAGNLDVPSLRAAGLIGGRSLFKNSSIFSMVLLRRNI
jgi:hypothetical protein